MQMRVRVSSVAWLLVMICVPCLAHAQVRFEAAGARALGMAGAFVAVADDPTAVLWNPAALVHGAPAALTIGLDRFQFRKPSDPAVLGGGDASSEFFGFGSWPLGVSYGHFSAAGLRRPGDLHTLAESLSLHQIGFSVLQTLLDGDIRGERATLTGGATFKYVRGTAGSAVIPGDLSVDDALDLARSGTGDANNTFDLDVGLLADLGRFRAGLSLKNLRSPSFPTSAGTEIRLARLARIGLSARPVDGVTLAIDVDLDTADPLVGQRQVIALGGETRISARAALRGGVRWHYSGVRQPTGALGGSLRLRPGLWLDGYVALGRSHDQGFGIALRGGLF
jgi:hypothetical protein